MWRVLFIWTLPPKVPRGTGARKVRRLARSERRWLRLPRCNPVADGNFEPRRFNGWWFGLWEVREARRISNEEFFNGRKQVAIGSFLLCCVNSQIKNEIMKKEEHVNTIITTTKNKTLLQSTPSIKYGFPLKLYLRDQSCSSECFTSQCHLARVLNEKL